jgi:hydroxypyruvate isomerase
MQYPHRLDTIALANALGDAGVKLVMFNIDPGDRVGGHGGLLCVAGRERAFEQTVEAGLELARILGVSRLNVPAGTIPPGVDARAVWELVVANLRRAAATAEAAGVTLMIEPLNPIDRPGYFLVDVDAAARLLSDVDRPNVRLQFDAYHAGITGDAVRALRRYCAIVEHVQVSDHPGRHEPGTGQLPLKAVLDELEATGYSGHVGLEYHPILGTLASFDAAERVLGRRLRERGSSAVADNQ